MPVGGLSHTTASGRGPIQPCLEVLKQQSSQPREHWHVIGIIQSSKLKSVHNTNYPGVVVWNTPSQLKYHAFESNEELPVTNSWTRQTSPFNPSCRNLLGQLAYYMLWAWSHLGMGLFCCDKPSVPFWGGALLEPEVMDTSQKCVRRSNLIAVVCVFWAVTSCELNQGTQKWDTSVSTGVYWA